MKSTIENETPNAMWANWALLQEWDKNDLSLDDRAQLGQYIAARLEATQKAATGRGPTSYVIATNDGNWSRGESLPDAARKCHGSASARCFAWVVLNDATAEVSQGGACIANSGAMIISLGVIGTISSLRRADRPNG